VMRLVDVVHYVGKWFVGDKQPSPITFFLFLFLLKNIKEGDGGWKTVPHVSALHYVTMDFLLV
jgi:hypothetical protein